MAVVLPQGKQQFFDSAGNLLAAGRLYTYVPGTSTPKAAYTTSAGTTPHTNPIVLDARGEAAIYWTGAYDVVLRTSADALIWGPERLETPSPASVETDLAALETALANTSIVGEGDAMIGFRRTNTGGEGMTLHAWHEFQVLNVREFGATGDGVTNDYADIQACIDACEAAGGGVVYFPTGTYICNTPLLVPGGVNLIGEGRESTTIRKDSTTTIAPTISAGALVGGYPGALPANLNAVIVLTGTGQRYTGRIAGLTIASTLATPGNYETQKAEFGIVSVGSCSEFAVEDCKIEQVQYAMVLPVVFVARIHNVRAEACLRAFFINNGTSTSISQSYANNCRDYGYFLRDLKYSEISGNACDYLNDPAKYPTRTRTCAAYTFRSCLGVVVTNNGDESTWGRSYVFDSFDRSLCENNLSISIGSDYTGADEIAVYYSTNVMLGSRVMNNFAYNVKSGGLTYGGAVAGQHHNIYFEGTTFLERIVFRDNLVASARNGTTEAGWGNNTFYEWLTGSATYDPPNLADGAGATTTVTVSGAALGDYARATFSLDLQGITLTAWVSSANTVSVRFQNESGGALDLSSGTLRARVEKA